MAPAPVCWPAAMFSADALVPKFAARWPKRSLPRIGDVCEKKPRVAMSLLWSRAASESRGSIRSSRRPSR